MCGINDRSYYSLDLSPVTATWGYLVGRGVGLGSSAQRTVLLMLLFSGMGCPAVWKNFIPKMQAETLVPLCQTEPCRILHYRDYNIYLRGTLNVVVSGCLSVLQPGTEPNSISRASHLTDRTGEQQNRWGGDSYVITNHLRAYQPLCHRWLAYEWTDRLAPISSTFAEPSKSLLFLVQLW
jgi:hypothetical protein